MSALISTLLLLAQDPPSPAPRAEPDVSISVTARAEEVRWRQVGSIRVRAWAEPGGTVVEENLSTGLPRPIPGQRTFRDVTWSLRGEAWLAPPSDDRQTDPSPEESPQ